MKTTRFLAQGLIAALTVLGVSGCHGKLPRPGKPTAPQEQSQRERPLGWKGALRLQRLVETDQRVARTRVGPARLHD